MVLTRLIEPPPTAIPPPIPLPAGGGLGLLMPGAPPTARFVATVQLTTQAGPPVFIPPPKPLPPAPPGRPAKPGPPSPPVAACPLRVQFVRVENSALEAQIPPPALAAPGPPEPAL